MMVIDVGPPLGPVGATVGGTVVEFRVCAFGTVVPPMDIEGCYEKTLPTTHAQGIQPS
jgi:hypothetical protein